MINKLIEYRTLTKLYNTYIIGIKNSIKEDNKLHTIYTQTLTRTGRLSSIEPNLQNIPIRFEEGKLIRKAFVPEEDCTFISSDYSQIELRVFASMANEESMIKAFKDGMAKFTDAQYEACAIYAKFLNLSAVTDTVGGVISGYSDIGSVVSVMPPAKIISSEITNANIGLLIKNLDI